MRALMALLCAIQLLEGALSARSLQSNGPVGSTNSTVSVDLSTTRIKEVMNRAHDCIKRNPFYSSGLEYHFPLDAEQHYKDILNITKTFRQVTVHPWADYPGPWIENLYIDHFIAKPLSYFSGLFPLFIQWTDIHCAEWEEPKNTSNPTRELLRNTLKSVLRKDVLYVTVDQDDQGIFEPLAKEFPNILSLSAGGFGHVPIPLIKGEIPYQEPPKASSDFEWTVGFFGSNRDRLSRGAMLQQLEHAMRTSHVKYHFAKSASWKEDILKSKFNLAPRGWGRTSFRLAEIIQSGRVPVYMYDDYEWVPYQGSFEGFDKYGLIGRMNEAQKTVDAMIKMSDEAYKKLIEHVKTIRHLYTYRGAIEQIELFFSDPFGDGGGYLRCAVHQPKKDHRLMRH